MKPHISEVPSVMETPMPQIDGCMTLAALRIAREHGLESTEFPSPLRWSSTPPTEAGFFWWKSNSPGVEMVEVIFSDGVLVDCDDDTAVAEWGGSWAGPIPLPQE